ncbi:hypothetical protein ACB035_10400 [Aeromonas sp. S12(2024)]|uniref:hypothetical protein n=1 Tax=Aeromonas sp. S12(2024) TaxID=3242885 RepID=UPI003527DF35
MKYKLTKNALAISVVMAIGSGQVMALISEETAIMMGHPPVGSLDVPLKNLAGAQLGAADKIRPTHTFEVLDSQTDEDGDDRLEQEIYYQWVKPAAPTDTTVTVDSSKWINYQRGDKVTVTPNEIGSHLVVKFTPKTVAGTYPDTGERVYWATVANVIEEGKTYTPNGNRGVVEGNTIIPEQALTKVVPVIESGDTWRSLQSKYPDLYTEGAENSPIVHAVWKATYTCVPSIEASLCNDSTKYSHKWRYEESPGVWQEIPGATAAQYQVTREYQGKKLSVEVTPNQTFIDAVESMIRDGKLVN